MTRSTPKLPCLYFVHAGKYTYVRTYSSKWEQMPNGRMGSVKRNIKTVGRIDNSSGLGEVHFKAEFLAQFPELNRYNVTRQTSASRQGGHQLIFTPRTDHAGTGGTAISAAADDRADPMLQALQQMAELEKENSSLRTEVKCLKE
ncbi:MAG: hypothetical protein IAB19_09565 [Proteobacteria bacterium]|uniref:Uncharacterized protein n=1 Tax=Candidatus Avisuccinivibrio stercorigallinarum TaxID=2840704 RepID=A0A9D9GU39_9GAMM|nr:hypothetical protein [Candidatus Avisuccinivibrio stercorigallinarum]